MNHATLVDQWAQFECCSCYWCWCCKLALVVTPLGFESIEQTKARTHTTKSTVHSHGNNSNSNSNLRKFQIATDRLLVRAQLTHQTKLGSHTRQTNSPPTAPTLLLLLLLLHLVRRPTFASLDRRKQVSERWLKLAKVVGCENATSAVRSAFSLELGPTHTHKQRLRFNVSVGQQASECNNNNDNRTFAASSSSFTFANFSSLHTHTQLVFNVNHFAQIHFTSLEFIWSSSFVVVVVI